VVILGGGEGAKKIMERRGLILSRRMPTSAFVWVSVRASPVVLTCSFLQDIRPDNMMRNQHGGGCNAHMRLSIEIRRFGGVDRGHCMN
jgi:hypothetical protein